MRSLRLSGLCVKAISPRPPVLSFENGVVQRHIVGFHQDDEHHWVADLECGHSQHVRHDPPWQNRPWVLTEESRATFIGVELNCVKCDVDRAEPEHRDR